MSYRSPDPLVHCPECIAAAFNDMAFIQQQAEQLLNN